MQSDSPAKAEVLCVCKGKGSLPLSFVEDIKTGEETRWHDGLVRRLRLLRPQVSCHLFKQLVHQCSIHISFEVPTDLTKNHQSNMNPSSTRGLLLEWGHLSRHRRMQLFLLLLVMLASGATELVSLGAVLPFLALLSDPDRLFQQPLVRVGTLARLTEARLLLPTTLMFALAAVLAALVRLTNLWLNGRMAAAVGSDLSCESYRRTLYQPYRVHVQRNSANVITAITSHTNLTVTASIVFRRSPLVWWLLGC